MHCNIIGEHKKKDRLAADPPNPEKAARSIAGHFRLLGAFCGAILICITGRTGWPWRLGGGFILDCFALPLATTSHLVATATSICSKPIKLEAVDLMQKSPQELDRIVGRNIRVYRLAQGLSQTELADQLGLTFQQVQKYEKGLNRVGAGRLFEISKILDVPLLSMFEGSKVPQSKGGRPSPFDLLADPLSLRLVEAFSEIAEPRTRHSLVAFVESIIASHKS